MAGWLEGTLPLGRGPAPSEHQHPRPTRSSSLSHTLSRTQGTPHYENEQRKSAATDAKIARMKGQLAGMGAGELAAHAAAMDAKLAELEASRDLSRTWCAAAAAAVASMRQQERFSG